MARKSQTVEFLNGLYILSEAASEAAFAKACGKHASNMHNYLRGKPAPGRRFLVSCMEHLFGWSVAPVLEIAPVPTLSTLSDQAGVYVIYDSGAQVLYIGKATNLRAEVRQTFGRRIPLGLRLGPKLKKVRPKISTLAKYISLYEIPSPWVRHNFEALLLRVFANQTHNSNIGVLKR